jgi:hypothetical protein
MPDQVKDTKTMNDQVEKLSNGLPLPPIPQRLREMLKDYSGHLQQLQEDLNITLDGPRPARGSINHVFEQIIWALEGCLDAFIRDAKAELRAAHAGGDSEAIARADAKEDLMFSRLLKYLPKQ